jgi:DNA-binding CsgD family transcriptional regulator
VVVQAAARGLAEVGQAWEGARLAGHGAARAQDRRDAAALLECARDLQAPVQVAGSAASAAHPTPAETKAGVVPLSAREREVVELVLAGMTYRQIGESLYLSAKTVEHHMARIRRRSGASSRSDLLGRLSISLG